MKKYESKISLKEINKRKEIKFIDALGELYMEYINEVGGSNFSTFGKGIAEAIVETFRSHTYGEYPKNLANDNLMNFMKGFNSVTKRV